MTPEEIELAMLRELYEAVVTVAMWDKSIQQGAISKYVAAKDHMIYKARQIYRFKEIHAANAMVQK